MSLHLASPLSPRSPRSRAAAVERANGYGSVGQSDGTLQARHSFAGALDDAPQPLRADAPLNPGAAAGAAPPEDRPGWDATRYVILNQFFERLTFYGLSGTVALFLIRELGYSNAEADTQLALWMGASYFFPLLGGWVADAYWGRYRTVVTFYVPYLGGIALVAATAVMEKPSAWLFFAGIYAVAVGSGFNKPLLSALGADQFAEEEDSYWTALYWTMNVGACLSFTVLVYICQNVSFALGYSVAAVSLALSLLFFMGGSGKYYRAPPGGSVLSKTAAIIYEGLFPVPGAGDDRELLRASGAAPAPSWLDRASRAYGGRHDEKSVAGVRAVLAQIPFLLLLITYWALNSQMTATFFSQGCQMNLELGSLTIPVAALNLFNSFIIILLVPVFDRVIYPGLERMGVPLSTLGKMGWGMVLELVVMVGAGMLEVRRKELAAAGDFAGPSVCMSGDDVPMAVNLSILWQIPAFVLIGASEILTSIASMQFFFSTAPEEQKGVCSALELLTVCLGQWVTAGLIPLVNSNPDDEWIPRDLNEGHLDKFFFLLAGLMAVNVVVFVWASRRHSAGAGGGGESSSV